MTKRKLAVILVAAFTCVCVSGCGSHVDSGPSDQGRTDSGASSSYVGADGYESGYDDSYENGYDGDYDGAPVEDDYGDYANSAYEDEAYAYPASEMGNLDGVFIMRPSEDKLLNLPEPMSHRVLYEIDGYPSADESRKMSGYMCSTYADPLEVDRADEKLVLLGQEGGNRAPADQDSIWIYDCELLGYTAKYLTDDERFDPTDFENIKNARIISYDYGRLDWAYTLVSDTKGATCEYNEYEGTTYETRTLEMYNPQYLVPTEGAREVPVIRTHDGYFEVDISSLSSGLYVLDSYTGLYPFVIK